MRRPLTPSELLVGRRLPKEASYRDQLLSGHLREDGSGCGRMTPGERWLAAPHKSLRKAGLIRSGGRLSLLGGRPVDIWYLTESGQAEAQQAKLRVIAAREARAAWVADFQAARLAEKAHAAADPDPC